MDTSILGPSGPEHRPISVRKISKRKVAAVGGALALIGGLGVSQLGGGGGASAEPIDTTVSSSCAVGGVAVDVDVPITVDDKVDTIAPGEVQTLETKTGLPALPIEATVNSFSVTYPIPSQVASTDSVTFRGGNVEGTYEVADGNLVVSFTGPISSRDIDVPVVVAEHRLTGDATGPIEWKTFTQIVADTNFGVATCSPNDADLVLNSTEVTGGSTPEEPTTPTVPGTPEVPGAPETPEIPGAPEVPGGPPVPGVPGLPGLPGLPETPGVPGIPGLPEIPGVPGVPEVPGAPTDPGGPGLPTIPGVPGLPTGPCPTIPGVPLPELPVGCPPIPLPPLPVPPPVPSLPGVPLPGGGVHIDIDVEASVGLF